MKVAIGYPTSEEENAILLRFKESDPLETLEPVVKAEEVTTMQEKVRQVRVEDSVRQYVVEIARATREHQDVEVGVSPRGTMSLYHTCQALAAIRGREYVIPDDVKYLAPHVLTHRVIINPKTRLRGRTQADVIDDIVESVAVPVETA
jgi:MoxR-like ATPase